MSQQLRQLRGRIRSIEGTWKVTRAMEMVSMAKYKAMEEPLLRMRTYAGKLRSILSRLLTARGAGGHPFFSSRPGPRGLCVITSDTGLCGGYMGDIISRAEGVMSGAETPVRLYVYGRKGQSYWKKEGVPMAGAFPGLHGRVSGNFHLPILSAIRQDYEKGLVGGVDVVHTLFHNAMTREIVVAPLLPVQVDPAGGDDVIIEDDGEDIFSAVLEMYLSSQFRLMMMESLVSEYSARMVAMKTSKDNAKELIGDLVLYRNKMRQAIITREVIEIISSAEALKG
ncbi:MAG: ATP synthase F1 subunit gamma [Elusimicrobia bacterium]|nr:ATP synthase F1 subunit gamma [Elusimicrobiota bacterium]